MFACNGLFNHESPRRGETFVTRKITRGLARIDAGLEECLFMGNLDALRDWGHARDYVDMQWRMLQQDKPEDFVIATGRQESVRRFIELPALWAGSTAMDGVGLEEVGRRSDTGAVVVKIDPRYFRPAEVETLLGDATRAREKLGWTPNTTLEEMVNEMVDHDREEARKEAYLNARASRWWDQGITKPWGCLDQRERSFVCSRCQRHGRQCNLAPSSAAAMAIQFREELVDLSRHELNLLDDDAVRHWMNEQQPDAFCCSNRH